MIQALQFILSLSILIVLHELGHFIPAKLFKTRIEKFYLFFDPWFSLFKIKKGETEYGIGWLPLGGYVKISGMIDESMDKEQMKLPAEPWEFRSKPAWQRLIIMCGGVTVNVILGMVIYAMVLFVWGEKYLPTHNVKYGVYCDSIGLGMGLHHGDKVLGVDHKAIDNFAKIPMELVLHKAGTIQIERDGKALDIPVKDEVFAAMIRSKAHLFEPAIPCEVDSVIPNTPAAKAGLLRNDKIIGIGEVSTPFFQSVVAELGVQKGKSTLIKVKRGNDTLSLSCEISKEGKLGFSRKSEREYFEFATRSYGFFGAFPAGIHLAVESMGDYLQNMKLLFTVKDAHKSLVGFIGIGKMYSPSWDWERFWSFTGLLSLMLAIMNILPIPALDGGHVVFLIYEVITGRKPNEKVMEYAQYAGMILLLSAVLYVNGNDVFKLFGGK